MMKWQGIFLMWLGVGLLVSPSLWAERHDPGPPHPEEGWQGQHPEKDQDGGSQYSRGPRDGEGFRRGPQDTGIMGSSERGPGRGRGFGGSPERGGNGGPGERDGFRSRFGRVGTAELMAFLKEHEPELAEKLEKLQKEDEKKFEWQISALKRMYGPIMRMMDENPEMAKLSLKSIRLRVQLQETVKKAKEGADDKAKQAAAQELTGKLGELFDVIVSLEEIRLNDFEKRMKEWPSQAEKLRGSSSTAVKDEERERRDTRRGPGSRSEGSIDEGRGSFRGGRGPGGPGGRGGFGGPGRGPGPGGFDRERFAEFARSHMEQKKKNIVIWKENKDRIVQQRSDELLKGLQPFPWGG
jgi:hypothetical protein